MLTLYSKGEGMESLVRSLFPSLLQFINDTLDGIKWAVHTWKDHAVEGRGGEEEDQSIDTV